MANKIRSARSIIVALFLSVIPVCGLCAQVDGNAASLSKKIMEAKSSQELYAPFKELKDLYFKDNRYADFVGSLKSLSQKNKALEPFSGYYTALARYSQLKYLEETQKWDEYFAQGNAYRDELTQSAQNTLNSTTAKDPLNIYTRLILWQFHKDQQDVFAEAALADLMNSVLEYSKSASNLEPIKEAADKILSYGEKGKSRELYGIYAEKLAASDINNEALADIALGFYKEGNLELSESIYNIYIDRAAGSMPKEKLIPVLTGIAEEFAYKDQGYCDPVYAEKIFKKIEELGGNRAFSEELMYLRAFNLEKARDYRKAKDAFVELTTAFPETSHFDEALFKAGIIDTYVLRDKKEGKSYFEKVIQKKQAPSPQVISSFYQLGLLSQWEDNPAGAKDYYNRLIEAAGKNYQQSAASARERLKEIEEARPMEYNLKTFLDICLNEEYAMFDMSKVELKSRPYKAKKEEPVNISTVAYTSPTGCLQVELQYLWSGDLGSNKPSSLGQSVLDTTYTETGTKVVGLLVVSPTGIIDRSLDLVDVY
ncbi:MAG: hypothetical protein WC723_06440 [Candidatus Omnitrophota bacterium]